MTTATELTVEFPEQARRQFEAWVKQLPPTETLDEQTEVANDTFTFKVSRNTKSA